MIKIWAQFYRCTCGRLLLRNGHGVACLCIRDQGNLSRAERQSVLRGRQRAARLKP